MRNDDSKVINLRICLTLHFKKKTNQETPISRGSIQQSRTYILKTNLPSLFALLIPILENPRSGCDLLADRGAKEMPEGGRRETSADGEVANCAATGEAAS